MYQTAIHYRDTGKSQKVSQSEREKYKARVYPQTET